MESRGGSVRWGRGEWIVGWRDEDQERGQRSGLRQRGLRERGSHSGEPGRRHGAESVGIPSVGEGRTRRRDGRGADDDARSFEGATDLGTAGVVGKECAARPSIDGLRTAGEALMAQTAGAAGPSIDGRRGIAGRGAGRERSARWQRWQNQSVDAYSPHI
uniref:Uncharacterized protein n=1 Tax=Zea mays TaxID=4577 RepID=A0A804QZR9_MAIZE